MATRTYDRIRILLRRLERESRQRRRCDECKREQHCSACWCCDETLDG